MAKFTLSGLVSDASGKLGGSVIFRRKGILLERNYKKPVQPGSPSQLAQQAIWRLLRNSWGTISDAQRNSWAFAAAQIFWVNPVGTRYHPTPQQLYLACNANLNAATINPINSFVSPGQFTEVTNPQFWYSDPTAVVFGVSFAGQTTSTNVNYLIYASKGVSAGISNGENYLRLIGFIPAGTANNYDFTTQYLLKFPAPSVGQRVFFKLRPVEINSGLPGIESRFNTIYTHSGAPPFVPTDIAGLQLWCDSNTGIIKDIDNNISLWSDQSGNSHHLSQVTPSAQPLFVPAVLNGLPVVSFNGVNSVLKSLPFVISQPVDIFIVFRSNRYSVEDYIFDGSAGNDLAFALGSIWGGCIIYQGLVLTAPAFPISQFNFIETLYNSVYSSINVNNLAPVVGNVGVASAGGFTLGGYAGGGFSSQIDVACVLIYDSVLSPSDRSKVVNYLKLRYALS